MIIANATFVSLANYFNDIRSIKHAAILAGHSLQGCNRHGHLSLVAENTSRLFLVRDITKKNATTSAFLKTLSFCLAYS